MITVSGVQAPADTSSWSPVASKIYERKKNSPVTYRYSSLQQLRFEFELRAAIVAAAKDLSSSGMRFSSFKRAKCNERVWRLTKEGGFRIRNDVTPAAGIRDIYENGRLYATECATATVIVVYKGILDCIRETDFNFLFSGLLLYDWHVDQDLQLTKQPGIEEAYPGDLLYFDNPDFSPETPQWRGENVVKLDDDLYYGHPFGILPERAIIAGLNRFRRAGSEKSAYLMDEIVQPGYSYLSQFASNAPRVAIARIGRRVLVH